MSLVTFSAVIIAELMVIFGTWLKTAGQIRQAIRAVNGVQVGVLSMILLRDGAMKSILTIKSDQLPSDTGSLYFM